MQADRAQLTAPSDLVASAKQTNIVLCVFHCDTTCVAKMAGATKHQNTFHSNGQIRSRTTTERLFHRNDTKNNPSGRGRLAASVAEAGERTITARAKFVACARAWAHTHDVFVCVSRYGP